MFLTYILFILFITTNASGNSTEVVHRLPENVVPKHYDLSVHPHFDNKTFTAIVVINITVKNDLQVNHVLKDHKN